MARIDFEAEDLNVLAARYVENKSVADEYDKKCKEDGTKIKEIMSEQNLKDFPVGDKSLNLVIQHKEEIDEGKLLAVLKKYNIESAIKTIEVVDMDALESFLYNHDNLDSAIYTDLADCKTMKEIKTLRIGKAKKRQEDY